MMNNNKKLIDFYLGADSIVVRWKPRYEFNLSLMNEKENWRD